MNWQKAFRVIIRIIFIFAYIAFLAASIRHVATFFHNFEADPADWVNPYTLAVSIDLTALVLTVGVMFFRSNMPWYAQSFTWLFIIALTAFSWLVNWEYAMTFQGTDLRVNDTLRMLNPILASSFAFLNLAYSVVAEFFSSKTETASELAAKVDELEQLEEQQRRLAEYRERTKHPSVIQRVKNTALEARAAVSEVQAANQLAKAENPSNAAVEADFADSQSVEAMVNENLDIVPSLSDEQMSIVQVEMQAVASHAVSAPSYSYQYGQSESGFISSNEVITNPPVQGTEGEEEFITEPLTRDASHYSIEGRQDGMVFEAEEETFEVRENEENHVLLPAWAGGEDVNTFLSDEEMTPYIPGNTAAMSRLSSSTGKLTRRKPMTVLEAAEALELSESHIRNLRSQGILAKDESNKIKVASVNAYMNKRKAKVAQTIES